uniref:Uncharacterized protein n=1 Tax=Moniliophthora roreri TaxID=221103 RepID=A0A0W0GFH8_MONRR
MFKVLEMLQKAAEARDS